MFLTVEWAKRWLPAIFLLLSIHLPWSAVVHYEVFGMYEGAYVTECSLLWSEGRFYLRYSPLTGLFFYFQPAVRAYMYAFLASSLILLGGLSGLSGKNRTRRLGGFFGILGILTYFLFVFPQSNVYYYYQSALNSPRKPWHFNPYFGIEYSRLYSPPFRALWFLSPGFFFALAGSLMLLSPIIRTGIERIRKRSSSSKQIIKEQLGTSDIKKEGSLGEYS